MNNTNERTREMPFKLYFTGKRNFLFFIYLIIGIHFATSNVYGWYTENHQRISRAAIDLLPEWELSMLKSAADSLVKSYCMFPDWHRSALHNNDEEKIAEYGPYVQLPLLQDLRIWHNNSDTDSEICFYIVADLMHSSVQQLRSDNPMEAARYMGHFIEDNACPVHVVDNNLLRELMPVPDELEPFPLHRRVEEPTFPLEVPDYQVKELGTDIIEAATAFYPRFLEIRRSGRAQSIPILRAIYAGNRAEADAGRAQAAIPAVKLIADIIHTICTIAQDRD
jgi:hypothetical protein